MKLPPQVVRYLREEGHLSWEKDGSNIIFDRESVERFQSKFDRDDYLTKSECDLKFATFRTMVLQPTKNPKKKLGIHDHPCGIYISTKKLIEGSSEIPEEYRLDVRAFGETKYITRKSVAKTLSWLKKLYRKRNPLHKPYVGKKIERKRSRESVRIRGLRIIKPAPYIPDAETEARKAESERKYQEREDRLRRILRGRLITETSS